MTQPLPPKPPKDVPRFTLMSHSHHKEMKRTVEQVQKAYRDRSENDFLCFVRGITIAGQQGPRLFENCMAMFQRECFEDIAPSVEAVRNGGIPPTKRWWIERTKKAGKDSDLALILLWVIAFPRRPFYAQVGAADKTQAAIVKERIIDLLHWNPWLNHYVELVQWEVRSKRTTNSGEPLAKLHIMSSDIAGAHGGTPDLLVINELSHIDKWEFVENLMDNADGVARGLVIIATNAGILGTKADVWRNAAINEKESGWGFHVWSRPAPWHDTETIRQAKARNSHSRFLRLWQGAWTSGKGDALDEEAIAKCFELKGPTMRQEVGWEYMGGLDIGIKNDRSGLVVLAINPQDQIIKTVYWEIWHPNETTKEVDLQKVENRCLEIHSIFNLRALFYDPYEARLMAQRLTRRNVPMMEMSFSSPKNLTRMATDFIQVVNDGKLKCYDNKDGNLRSDFGRFNIVEKSYGYKLEAIRDESGHADVGTALVICLSPAVELMKGYLGLHPTDDLTDMNTDPLTGDEIEEMPQELRELYTMEDRREPWEEVENDPFFYYP